MSTTQSPALANITDSLNVNQYRRLLTDTNFKVLSVKPLTEQNGLSNTEAVIQIDLYAEATTALPVAASDRYSVRKVQFTRVNLADVPAVAGLLENADGTYTGEVKTYSDVENILGIILDANDVTITPVGTKVVVTANDMSLGWYGQITFESAGANAVQAIAVNPTSVSAAVGTTTPVAVTVTPSTASSKFSLENYDPTVITATLHADGKGFDVTTVKVGTTNITLISDENPEVTTTLAVTVTATQTTVQPASNVNASTSNNNSGTTTK